MRCRVAAALGPEGAVGAVLSVQREAGARQHCQAAQEPLPVRPGTRALAGRVLNKLGNRFQTTNQHNLSTSQQFGSDLALITKHFKIGTDVRDVVYFFEAF